MIGWSTGVTPTTSEPKDSVVLNYQMGLDPVTQQATDGRRRYQIIAAERGLMSASGTLYTKGKTAKVNALGPQVFSI